MTVKTKIVEATASELTKKAIALLLPLLSTLVLALVPPLRDRILPVLPKPLLAVLLGLTLSLNLALGFYILYLSNGRKLKPRFGVVWNRSLTPFCPVHKEIALANWGNLGTHEPQGYICPEGPHVIPLQDDEGNYLKPADARKLLVETDANSCQVTDTYQPDSVGVKALSFLAQARSDVEHDHLTNHLRLHPGRVSLYLSELENRGYLYSQFVGIAGAPITYHLTNKGRTFLAIKNLI
ncbi:MAG TPA: hypothetical protein VNO50_22380 [Pyrinomonadaceae bacterium]|nr:hypothetical protein [Pyrinomonadaceae bacterium]